MKVPLQRTADAESGILLERSRMPGWLGPTEAKTPGHPTRSKLLAAGADLIASLDARHRLSAKRRTVPAPSAPVMILVQRFSTAMRRVTSLELLDSGLLALDEIHANLDDLWRTNRYLGGVSTSLRLLGACLVRTGKRRLSILEVGAGDGRLAARLRRQLRQDGVEAEFFVLDCRLSHLLAGRAVAESLHPVAADALALPFPHGSFDFVVCNLMLHHFSGHRAVQLLSALSDVAQDAVVINDLRRHWLPWAFARTIPWFWRHRVSRLDGAASVRQAYTKPELAELAIAAGFTNIEVHRLAPFRLGLVVWKACAP